MKKKKSRVRARVRLPAGAPAHLGDLTWGRVKGLSRDTPVIFPIAAVEQHGSHLPLFVDSMLLGEIVRRVAERMNGQAIFAPLLWLGNSDHHLDFPGTLSASPRTYLAVISDLAENFLRHGFRRIVFLNGHGGNDGPAKQAMFEVRQKYREREDLLLLVATYWQQADPARLQALDTRQGQMGHACEWETSMMLRLAPRLVGDYRNVPASEMKGMFPFGARAWVTQDRTKAGHIGSPQFASAEKGEALLEIFSDGVIDLLQRVVTWDGKSW